MGQISEEELKKIEISDFSILPQYTGKMYEYVAGFPLEKENQKDLMHVQERIGIKNVLPEEITAEHIRKIYNYPDLNIREKNYMLIKLGFPKNQMEEFLIHTDSANFINQFRKGLRSKRTIDVRQIGQMAKKQTTAVERKMVGETLKKEREKDDKDLYKG